jgi:N-acetyl-anhydromuramyl-L-alanine amidase AmpD
MTATSDGWCPIAIKKPVPSHKFWRGNQGRASVVMHVSQGTMQSMIDWFLGRSEATAHFGIGLDGKLYQFVSVHDSAFGNGASMRNGRWHDPRGHVIQPAWVDLRPEVNPNWYTISVEHAGFWRDPWTAEMDSTNTRLLIWLAQQFPSLAPYVPGRTLIGHCDISPIERKNCPGPTVDYARIAAAANQGLEPPPLAEDTITEDSSIIGQPRASAAQAAHYMGARPHGEYTDADIARVIVPAYWELCQAVDVDPLVAVAQLIHETGNLTSWWSQRPRRNPAGIGVNGQPGVGLSFPTWKDDAIPAHIGRLLAYAISDGRATPRQRGLIATALHWRALPAKARGSAATLEALGRAHNPSGVGWASPGEQYGAQIAKIARAIQQEPA